MATVNVVKLSDIKRLACEMSGCSDGHADGCEGAFKLLVTGAVLSGGNLGVLRLGVEFSTHMASCTECDKVQPNTEFAKHKLCAYARALFKAGDAEMRK